MSMNTAVDWMHLNQRELAAQVARMIRLLRQHADLPVNGSDPDTADPDESSALAMLADTLQLTDFERDVLMLCAALELDARIAPLCAAAQGVDQRPWPTFSLALAALPGAYWNALLPTSPLRHWHLLEIAPGQPLTTARLSIDERILHYLTGMNYLDERLGTFAQRVPPVPELTPSQMAQVDSMRHAWESSGQPPVIQLCGPHTDERRRAASVLCQQLETPLWRINVDDLPTDSNNTRTLIRLWQRETLLQRVVLMLEVHDAHPESAALLRQVRIWAERLQAPLLISTPARLRDLPASTLSVDITRPTTEEQAKIWRRSLNAQAEQAAAIDALAMQFDLDTAAIESIARQEAASDHAALWQASRLRSRTRLDDRAQRIDSPASWEMLVLPEDTLDVLKQIEAHVRLRGQVYREWGFAAQGARGLGISALFAGSSGTGKTLAAEVLANTLHLDLYRIDLSTVVSKYVGETEKNLKAVFDAAEYGGVILFFDEADALFGKRSEVRDSHDRYANIEISYLLQRMEQYRGLAILTTNLRDNLDAAFTRRIRFIVNFDFPDAERRAGIWARMFPPDTPTQGLNWQHLAQLNIAGGAIRNIALNAAFLAADVGEPVRMAHIARAAQIEYAKSNRALTPAELRGWDL